MFAVIVFLIYSILLGYLYCFKGQQYFYPLLMLSVFLGCISTAIMEFGSGFFVILISAIIGLVLAILARVFYKVAMFFMGLFAGAALGVIISAILFIPLAIFSWLIVTITAVIFAIMAVAWSDTFITLATSFYGASLLVRSVGFVLFNLSKLSTYTSGGFFMTLVNMSEHVANGFPIQHPFINGLATLILFFIGWSYQKKQRKRTFW